MRVVIASGKGGTGKTTIATNLAVVAGDGAAYADLDVLVRNGHLFLDPTIDARMVVHVPKPRVDEQSCTHCGRCRAVCRFNALVVFPSEVEVYDGLCHSCGACSLACPESAIRGVPQRIGEIAIGRRGPLRFLAGRLDVAVVSSPPLIRAVKGRIPALDVVFADAPPGTACPAVEAVRGADLCLLVTEPTPFGLHDLSLAVDMLRALGVPFGVVINRDGIGDDGVERFCADEGVEIMATFRNDRRVAEAYARGDMIVDALPDLRRDFELLLERVLVASAAGGAL